jgi:hypothetical protein
MQQNFAKMAAEQNKHQQQYNPTGPNTMSNTNNNNNNNNNNNAVTTIPTNTIVNRIVDLNKLEKNQKKLTDKMEKLEKELNKKLEELLTLAEKKLAMKSAGTGHSTSSEESSDDGSDHNNNNNNNNNNNSHRGGSKSGNNSNNSTKPPSANALLSSRTGADSPVQFINNHRKVSFSDAPPPTADGPNNASFNSTTKKPLSAKNPFLQRVIALGNNNNNTNTNTASDIVSDTVRHPVSSSTPISPITISQEEKPSFDVIDRVVRLSPIVSIDSDYHSHNNHSHNNNNNNNGC